MTVGRRTVAVFMFDLNATMKSDFANFTAGYQEILRQIGEMADGCCKNNEFELEESCFCTSVRCPHTLIAFWTFAMSETVLVKVYFSIRMAGLSNYNRKEK